MTSIVEILAWAGGCGVLGSVLGVLTARFGKNNEERLKLGNASGVGFLIGAATGATIGVFQSLMGRL